MGTWYVPEIFVPSEKRIFYPLHFMVAICAQPALSGSLLRPLKPAFQMHHQQRHRRRRYAGNSASLSDGFGFVLIELLLHFGGEAFDFAVIDVVGQL